MWTKKFGAAVGGACLIGLGFAGGLIADDHADGMGSDSMDAWTAHMTPGPEHKEMAKYAGKWNMASKMWFDPAAPPQESTAKVTWEMIMDGRYMLEHVDGEPFQEGMPRFQGMNITGYDNFAKRYFFGWVDNMGTGLMVGYGESKDGGKTIEFYADAPDPMTGTMTRSKSIVRHVSADKVEFEMYSPNPDGEGWWKGFEATYTRAK